MKVTPIPIVVGALGTVPKGVEEVFISASYQTGFDSCLGFFFLIEDFREGRGRHSCPAGQCW